VSEERLQEYKVIRRRWLLLIAGGILAALIPAGLAILGLTDEYLTGVERLAKISPHAAREQLAALFRVLIMAGVALAATSGGYLGWHGYRVIRTGHNPPLGSWIFENQGITTGRRAVHIGYLQLGLALALVVTGAALGAVGRELLALLAGPGYGG
jgi:hypothetical protein